MNVGTCVATRSKYAGLSKYCSCGPNDWAEWPFDTFYDNELQETRVCVGGERNGKLCSQEVCMCVSLVKSTVSC